MLYYTHRRHDDNIEYCSLPNEPKNMYNIIRKLVFALNYGIIDNYYLTSGFFFF